MKTLIGKTVTVKRSEWQRGQQNSVFNGIEVKLLSKKTKKLCCLGFAALVAGFTPEEILDIAQPAELQEQIEGLTRIREYTEGFSSLQNTYDMMNVNDSGAYTDTERETKLQELAKNAGFEFVFVD